MVWPVGQVVKTAASHAANGSSTLPRVTTSFVKKGLDKGKKSAYNDLSLKRTVRRRKLKVSFAYFSFQGKVSWC